MSIVRSPIALFVYDRPEHTQRTVDALKQNILAQESDLIVFSDGPKTTLHTEGVDKVRRYLHEINGFKSVSIIERGVNLGLANSIIDGVTEIVNRHERIIVLEDDMVTSPYFLTYMNEALDKYADANRVISIHGYLYPVKEALPETFFLPGADCWGWATWRRGWDLFNSDGRYLLAELKRRKLTSDFDYNNAFPFSKMLEAQVAGVNDSWAIRWYASAFLADKVTLYPGHSLVHNIGNDSSGTHCRETSQFDVKLSQRRVNLGEIDVMPSLTGMKVFERYFKQAPRGFLHKLIWKLRVILRMAE